MYQNLNVFRFHIPCAFFLHFNLKIHAKKRQKCKKKVENIISKKQANKSRNAKKQVGCIWKLPFEFRESPAVGLSSINHRNEELSVSFGYLFWEYCCRWVYHGIFGIPYLLSSFLLFSSPYNYIYEIKCYKKTW